MPKKSEINEYSDSFNDSFCCDFVVVLPKSVHEEYIVENSRIFSFTLSDEDMDTLKSLDQGHHFCWSAENVM